MSKGEQRSLSPNNALDKLIKLMRKNTNFDYFDPFNKQQLKVVVSPPASQSFPQQHLLKGFWRHIQHYYFKSVDKVQLLRLLHLYRTSLRRPQPIFPQPSDPQFWQMLARTFSLQYLTRYERSEADSRDYMNWVNFLRLHWDCRHSPRRPPPSLRTLDRTNFLALETKLLRKALPPPAPHTEVDAQIKCLTAELGEVSARNAYLLELALRRVKTQIQREGVFYCVTSEQDAEHTTHKYSGFTAEELRIGALDLMDIQLKYYQKTIMRLEKAQLAQSISKVTKLERCKGQYRFSVQFQEGMNLETVTMSEQQLININSTRQYSVFKFYNTSLKSPYSFICQNYLGFQEIYSNRLQACTLRDKNILDCMKRSMGEGSARAAKQFNKFDICHHCKLLYPQYLLRRCQYRSSQHGVPIPPMHYHDPYLHQLHRHQQIRHLLPTAIRNRSPFFSYAYDNEEYSCLRSFCKYCLKQNYEDYPPQRKGGLCPFCQGVCFCTRCSRNDMIVRLQSLSLALGGNMLALTASTPLHHLIPALEDGKGDHPRLARKPAYPVLKIQDKMRNVRYELEDLRILCDLVKRREKLKMKLLDSQTTKFHVLLHTSSSVPFPIAIKAPCTPPKDQLQLKLAKKLKRMIS